MDLAIAIALFCILGSLSVPTWSLEGSTPPIMLAQSWQGSMNPSGYLVSEKLDGVRAYWDGRRLFSRSGLQIHAPAWFTARLPDVPLDGELWAGYGSFSRVSTLVRKIDLPVDDEWRGVRFMVFDMPANPNTFTDRYWVLKTLIEESGTPFVEVVRQRFVDSRVELDQWLQDVVGRGGEGLILKHGDSRYQARRSSDMLKYKPTQDAEAVVVGHVPGKGKYEGMVGALRVQLDDGREIRLGSGLTDAERQNPPGRGTRVTYAYDGYTSNGLPRFARFVRVRPLE